MSGWSHCPGCNSPLQWMVDQDDVQWERCPKECDWWMSHINFDLFGNQPNGDGVSPSMRGASAGYPHVRPANNQTDEGGPHNAS